MTVLSEMDRFGLLTCASPTGPVLSCSAPTRPPLPLQDDAQVARNIAGQAAVLLKDDNHALPLTLADLQSLALIGPTAGQLESRSSSR